MPESQQVFPLRHRAHHADQQERKVGGRAGEALPECDAGLVGPLEVIHDQDHRDGGGQLADQRKQLLSERRGHVLATAGRDLATQQGDDGFLPRITGRLTDS